MCKDVGMEPLGDIVARIVNELASGGRDAPSSLASASKLIVADQFAGRLPHYCSGHEYPAPRALSGSAFTAVARHSAEAELNGKTVGARSITPTVTAQAGPSGGDASRAHGRPEGAKATVINLGEKRAGRNRPQVSIGRNQTVAVGRTVTRQTVPLRNRR